MGVKDAAAKSFFGRPDIMASILNYVLYSGQLVVGQEQLKDLREGDYRIVKGPDGKFRTNNRFRDKLFECVLGGETIDAGLELQTRNDKRMVFRMMVYDARLYMHLFEQGEMRRIVNIVLSFDHSGRCGSTTLSEMVPKCGSDTDGVFFDYGFIGLNIYEIAEKSDMFPCNEMQDVLNLFKYENDEKGFMDVLTNGKLKGVLSRDAAILCAVFMGIDIDIGDKEESFDMCRAVRQIRAAGKDEGIRIGKDEGIRIGKDEGIRIGKDEGIRIGESNALRNMVKRLLGQSRSLLEICEITGMSRKTVKQIAAELQA